MEAYPPLCDVKGSFTAQFEHVRNAFASFVDLKILTICRLFYCDRISRKSSAEAMITDPLSSDPPRKHCHVPSLLE